MRTSKKWCPGAGSNHRHAVFSPLLYQLSYLGIWWLCNPFSEAFIGHAFAAVQPPQRLSGNHHPLMQFIGPVLFGQWVSISASKSSGGSTATAYCPPIQRCKSTSAQRFEQKGRNLAAVSAAFPSGISLAARFAERFGQGHYLAPPRHSSTPNSDIGPMRTGFLSPSNPSSSAFSTASCALSSFISIKSMATKPPKAHKRICLAAAACKLTASTSTQHCELTSIVVMASVASIIAKHLTAGQTQR